MSEAPMPWRRLLEVLTCPVCAGALVMAGGALRCGNRHAFDFARQGYVSLLTGDMHVPSADTAAMVRDRVDFLAAGHYRPLAEAMARSLAGGANAEVVLDCGAGTGYYLAAVLAALPHATGLALDASKYALRRAARAHPRMGAATWDVWRPLPVAAGSVDVVMNVFAPRNGPEYHRVLGRGGTLLVVTPTPRHLAELRASRGLLSVDEDKPERLRRTLGDLFRTEATEVCEYVLDLPAGDVANLVGMGPNAHHAGPRQQHHPAGEPDRATGSSPYDPVRVTASFRLSRYQPR